MGRNKHCSEEKRALIQRLQKEGQSYRSIAKIVGCSVGMIQNAITFREKNENRGRRRKTSAKMDRRIVSAAKRDPFMSSSQILKEVNADVSARTIRRRLLQSQLYARAPRKVPLLTPKHITQRTQFATDHITWTGEEGIKKWRNILWSDESKFVLFGSDSRKRVRRPPNKAFDPKYTKKTVKHGGGNIMVWACFSWFGVGPIHWIKETMTADVYVEILQDVMLPYAEENMPLLWTFQQDNDPKHTAKVTKEWFRNNKINCLKWPAQSPDCNPIENLWQIVKARLAPARPSNKQELWEAVKAAWESIPVNVCQKLVNSMPKRCRAVLKNRGHAINY